MYSRSTYVTAVAEAGVVCMSMLWASWLDAKIYLISNSAAAAATILLNSTSTNTPGVVIIYYASTIHLPCWKHHGQG
jgi:hypothetical protein